MDTIGRVVIQITEDFTAENGMLFWKGEKFTVPTNVSDGAEVKTAGEYVDIPSEKFRVLS